MPKCKAATTAKGFEKFVCAADNHGDMIDPFTEKAFFEFIEWFKPDHRVHMGDCFDLRWLRAKAAEQEKRETPRPDIDCGIDFLKRFKPDVYLLGNHENRLWRAAMSDDGKLATFASELIVDIKGVLGSTVILPYDKRLGVHRYGNRNFIHGFSSGVYALRQSALVYGNMAMAHVHASDVTSVARHDRCDGHSSGCLARTDMDYNATHQGTLRQTNGWLYGVKLASGETLVWHADKINGRFFLPSEFREIRNA